jgi:predicted ATPase/DNA-binding SARP family transcriptional activator
MEFQVLGPLAVVDRGRAVPLGGPSERHLLAALLCLANEPVPVGRLIDELWGDEPPASAKNVIQQYVSHIRRVLGDAHAQRLTTNPGGYVLHVEDDEVDWHRFQELVARAHDVRVPAQASELLTEALNVWHGPAFAGAGHGPTVDAERTRLEEARLAAVEDRIDCDLKLGRHRELVAELEGLLAKHPMRERLRGQLMLGFYRCDRQPEALHCYAEYRERLAEETGLQPSETLTRLEGRILTSDPGLDLPDAAGLPATNLPQRVSSFVGRRKEIAEARVRMLENRLVTLVGVGGIGKTSLALQAATELRLAFPDGVWLIDLAPLGDASLIGGTAAVVLGVGVGPRQDPTQAVADHLRDQEALIILDNCEHLVDAAAEFAKTMLQICAGVRVLATSRIALGVPGEAIMRVPSLQVPDQIEANVDEIAASEAATLFVDRARLLRPEFELDESNAGAVAEICCRLDGIPLAIELAAARLGTMPVHQIATHVEDRYHLLTKGARTAPHRHQTLRAMVDWSHDLLTESERTVLRRLGVFAGSFTADAAASVCGYEPLDPADVARALEQLVDASLINPPHPATTRLRMLETIREFARHHLDSAAETDKAMRRLATYLVEAGPDTENGYPASDFAEWYRWRNDEQDNFRTAIEWSLGVGDVDTAVATTIEFRIFLGIQELYDEATRYVKSTLALLGTEASHRRLLLSSFVTVNDAHRSDPPEMRQQARSLYDEACSLDEESTMGLARALESAAAWRMGDTNAAAVLNTDAITHLRKAGDPRVVDLLANQAVLLARLARYADAHSLIDQILDAVGEVGSRADERYAQYVANLSRALLATYTGKVDEIDRLLDCERGFSRDSGPENRSMYLYVSTIAALARDDAVTATSLASESRELLPATAHPGSLRDAATIQSLCVLESLGPEAARQHLQAALDFANQEYSLLETADVVTVIADAALATRTCTDALRLHAAASAVRDHSGIVLAPWQQQRLDRSIGTLQEALGDRFDDLWSEGSTLSVDEMIELATRYVDSKSN